MCVAMIVAGGVALYLRSTNQPASWQRWKTIQGERS
jgi:hypothetical protein